MSYSGGCWRCPTGRLTLFRLKPDGIRYLTSPAGNNVDFAGVQDPRILFILLRENTEMSAWAISLSDKNSPAKGAYCNPTGSKLRGIPVLEKEKRTLKNSMGMSLSAGCRSDFTISHSPTYSACIPPPVCFKTSAAWYAVEHAVFQCEWQQHQETQTSPSLPSVFLSCEP